jgi:hypothetical protein
MGGSLRSAVVAWRAEYAITSRSQGVERSLPASLHGAGRSDGGALLRSMRSLTTSHFRTAAVTSPPAASILPLPARPPKPSNGAGGAPVVDVGPLIRTISGPGGVAPHIRVLSHTVGIAPCSLLENSITGSLAAPARVFP